MVIAPELKAVMKQQQVKHLLPTSLTSAELEKLPADILAQATFSAQTTNASYLNQISKTIQRVIAPQDEVRPDGTVVQVGKSFADARVALQDSLAKIGYTPEGKPGSITDLSSDQRLNLIVKTQTEMARNRGYWKEGQDPDILSAWPAQELFRAEDRDEPREWPRRWAEAGGRFFPGQSDYPEGRMIALKSDPIWENISRFGLPYPPFDFQSGMDLRDITREEAIELGLMEPNQEIEPAPDDIPEHKASVSEYFSELQEAILDSLGDDYEIIDGVLTRVNEDGDFGKKGQPAESHQPLGNPQQTKGQ